MQHTLIRKQNLLFGDNNGLDLFDPSAEWDSLPVGTWGNLGSHTCNCLNTSYIADNSQTPSYLLYPNPVNSGNIINVSSRVAIRNIIVKNMIGQVVINTADNFIITNDLEAGTYIINIRFSDGREADNKIIVE